jgi:hypothetical protein
VSFVRRSRGYNLIDTELIVTDDGVGRLANQPNSLQINRLSRNTT